MRIRLIVAAALVLLLAGADWLACAALRHRMRAEYAAWVATVTAQGWTVHSSGLSEGGFPLGATLTLTGFTLSGGHAMLPGGLDWRAERVIVSAGLAHPLRLTVEPQGEQTIRLAGARAVVFSADRLAATVPLGRQLVDRLSLQADGLAAGMVQSQRQDVQIEHLELDLQANRRGAAHVTASAMVSASGIDLPDNTRWPLGDRVKSFGCVLDLTSPALSGAAAIDQARAWRDWGGALSVHDLRLEWGPAELHGEARLGLDGDLQPVGTGRATVSGWAQTVDALAAGGIMQPGMAQTVKVVLGLMTPSKAGALTLPLTLKDSTLSVGKIPLAQLRPVRWNGI
jgi:hypothetical protein